MLNNLLETLFGDNALDIFGETAAAERGCYYNPNTAHDRQIAGFGELTYSITDELKLTLGGRVAKTSFDITHFTDGPENYGPTGPASASQSETPFTPEGRLQLSDGPESSLLLHLCQGIPRRRRESAAADVLLGRL